MTGAIIRARFIPVLLLDRNRRLVKTVGFGQRTYVGDPFNVIRLFNEKEVDELCILDIDAGRDGRAIDTGFVAELAGECFMPLAYGGGLRSVADCAPLARNGVEKFVLGAGATDLVLIAAMARVFGSSSVIACIDYRNDRAMIDSGRSDTGLSPVELASAAVAAGAGEVILQSIVHDGCRSGMDIAAIARMSAAVDVPVVALGGAGDTKHLQQAISAGAAASASGSAFCFIGRLRAVLITYPDATIIVPDEPKDVPA